MAIQKVTIQLF